MERRIEQKIEVKEETLRHFLQVVNSPEEIEPGDIVYYRRGMRRTEYPLGDTPSIVIDTAEKTDYRFLIDKGCTGSPVDDPNGIIGVVLPTGNIVAMRVDLRYFTKKRP